MQEIWKNITDYNDYQVSNLARIKSKFGKPMSLNPDSKGYLKVNLWKNSKRKTLRVHRLMAIEFISNPNNLPFINHKDGNKLNNDLSNLEWCTQSHNAKHSFNELGNNNFKNYCSFGLDNIKSKKVYQYTKNGILIKAHNGVREAGRDTGINSQSISKTALGIRKSAGGYIWAY